MDIPRTIWFMWLQGLENAPVVVRECYRSWVDKNPGWNVVVLDRNNVDSYWSARRELGKDLADVAPQAFSDVVRINLLATRGGVWADATCFCCSPLDNWLGEHLAGGFFAFARPGKARLVASWFLAACANNRIAHVWCRLTNDYWMRNRFRNTERSHVANRIGKILDRNVKTTRYWFSSFMVRWVRLYPYFWFHYLFAEVLRRDETCLQLWTDARPLSAVPPHKLQTFGLERKATEALREDIAGRKTPIYKLRWKLKSDTLRDDSVFSVLVRSHAVIMADSRQS